MKTVLDFLGQLWLRFLKPDGSITVPHPNEGKAKRSSDSNSILQKSLETFLQERIEFRFNLLSEETEYRYKQLETDRFYPVTQRDLNSICMEARRTGIDCRDRDVNRFVIFKRSKRVSSFPAIYGVVTRMGRERPGKRSGTTGLLRTVMGGGVSSLDARLGLAMDGFGPNARK